MFLFWCTDNFGYNQVGHLFYAIFEFEYDDTPWDYFRHVPENGI